MTTQRDDDGFLTRWSRRKLDVEPAEPEVELPTATEPAEVEAAEEERSDEEILAELGLKHPDDLQPGDDIKGFMQAAVPDRLRRLALRQLWRGNPVLANLDGLVEYGEDYTDAATVVENMQTLYQVGKGMFIPEEVESEDETVRDDPVEEDAVEGDSVGADEVADQDDTADIEQSEVADSSVAADISQSRIENVAIANDLVAPDTLVVGPTNRRMAFQFD